MQHHVAVQRARRFKTAATVRVLDGRGGDGGIDVEVVTNDGRRRIFPLKYFPRDSRADGATAGAHRSRKAGTQARRMDPRGAQSPHRVGGQVRQGTQRRPGATDDQRGRELDSWVADDPSLDEYLQRDPNTNLERMARVYNQERRRERRNAAHDGVDLMQICY